MKLTKQEQARLIKAAASLRKRFGKLGDIGSAFVRFGGVELSAQHMRPYFSVLDEAKAGEVDKVSKTVANMLILLDVVMDIVDDRESESVVEQADAQKEYS